MCGASLTTYASAYLSKARLKEPGSGLNLLNASLSAGYKKAQVNGKHDVEEEEGAQEEGGGDGTCNASTCRAPPRHTDLRLRVGARERPDLTLALCVCVCVCVACRRGGVVAGRA